MNNLTASEALERLQRGNERFRHDKDKHPRNDASYRDSLAGGQTPFASVVTCSDSRVPPELIFDQGLGDLFVIRVAGNVCNDAVLGTIEYASMLLGVKLVVVMGHRSCGAVSAAVDHVDVDGPATHSHIDTLIDAIRPAVRAAEGAEDLLDRSVRENAAMVAAQIRKSDPVMTKLATEGVEVKPAYYDLESGKVEWLE